MTKKKKLEYCPYKEYWFGPGVEAQEKPAGFKYKRGTLLKMKKSTWFGYSNYKYYYGASEHRGHDTTLPEGFTKDTIALLVDYDVKIGKKKIRDFNYDPEWVETIKHTFTFFYNEKWDSVVMEVWGSLKDENIHDKMWCKARKRTHRPTKKKRKKRGRGFVIEDSEQE